MSQARKNHSANLQGRTFPEFDFLNSGIHTGAKGGNVIDQAAAADGLRHAADLLDTKQLVHAGGTAMVEGFPGQKRTLVVTNRFQLPD